jgi:hypothetical protein
MPTKAGKNKIYSNKNLLSRATPKLVKKKAGPKTTGMDIDSPNPNKKTSPAKTREREPPPKASPNDRPKTKVRMEDPKDEPRTPPSQRHPNTISPTTEEETVVLAKTATSQAFDETFKKLSKHVQIKGFRHYQDAKNRLNSALHSLNAVKGYQPESMEAHMACRDPSTWKELFSRVYKMKVPQLSTLEITSLKVLSVELAKTDPSIFPDVRTHPALSPDEGLIMAHTPHNAMLRGAGELWGHIWHLFPYTPPNEEAKAAQTPTNAWKTKLPPHPYKQTPSVTSLKEAPLPSERSYGELSMTKPSLPFEADFQTREKQQQELCSRLLLAFLSALAKGDKHAALLPIKANTKNPTRLTQKSLSGASTRTVQIFFRGFQIGIPGYEDTLHMRFLLAHSEDGEKLIKSIGSYLEQARFSEVSIRRAAIQDEYTVPAGWLMGSITKSINLQYLTEQIRTKLPAECKLEWQLENRELRHKHSSADYQSGKKRKSPLSISATYIMTKESHSRALTDLLCSQVYPASMTPHEAPGQMALRFVPDVTLPMNAASQAMQMVHTKMAARHLAIALPDNFKTHTTESIISLDATVPGRSFSLRFFILSLYHPRCRKKRLFLQVDHWATDPSKVEFTFHTSDETLAYEAIDALPLILKEQGVKDYGKLFVDGTKQDMVRRYAKDETGAYVPKRQKRFKELEQALEEEEEYDEIQMGYLEALLEEHATLTEDHDRNVISGMELLLHSNNVYNANEEASIASTSTLGTLKAPSKSPTASEHTPPTRNTKKPNSNSSGSSDSGSTFFSTDTMATLQAVSDTKALAAAEAEEDNDRHKTTLERNMIASMHQSIKGMEVDSGQEDSPQKEFPSKSNSQSSHRHLKDPLVIDSSSEDDSEDDQTDRHIQRLMNITANMKWTGDESTWPSQCSHYKCHQLLQDPVLLQTFLQEWLTRVAYPPDMDPTDAPEYSYIERVIKRVINDLTGKEALPLEALANILEETPLSQLEETYGLLVNPQTSSLTTGPSTEEGTGGEW